MDERPRYVLLGKVGDPGRARLLAARLESEGIDARVHGESLGPYSFTVGQMAVTEIWVAADDLDEAREVMLAAEVDDTLGSGDTEAAAVPPWPLSARLMALAVAIVIVALWVRRFLIALG